MATSTQYNPNADLNARLLAAGASKTVYALVTPQTEAAKQAVFAAPDYFEQFREAWTGKQEAAHVEFFDRWHEWSAPVVDLDRSAFPFYYPTAGASEPIRQIIFDFARRHNNRSMLPPMLHVFRGEYEGYKAMAEASGVQITEWDRADWRELVERLNGGHLGWMHMVFVSQPSAIDGMVWEDFNEFVESINMPNCVVADITYVGAVPEKAIKERFNLNARSIRNVVFSLSKPFGLYYDRIGGVFCREEDLGLFGNKWFKGLTGLMIGIEMLKRHDVFDMPRRYGGMQSIRTAEVGNALGMPLVEADVFILAKGPSPEAYGELGQYLARGGVARVCLTAGMAEEIGTA